MESGHVPVMVDKVISILAPKSSGIYVDCTLGLGGHAEAILEACHPDGVLVGIELDGESLEQAKSRLGRFGSRAVFLNDNFKNIAAIMDRLNLGPVDGCLFDFGLSSFQLATAFRGFSFQADGPLDMRCDRNSPKTAAELVNEMPPKELRSIIKKYGEEKLAGPIAHAIAKRRAIRPIETTFELKAIIEGVVGGVKKAKIHPATKTFQALRIAVNRELSNIEDGLKGAVYVLKLGGRLCAISYHSLEDRIVKRGLALFSKGCTCPPEVAICVCGGKKILRLLAKKPMLPGQDEIQSNRRARSAKLRAAEKIATFEVES